MTKKRGKQAIIKKSAAQISVLVPIGYNESNLLFDFKS